MSDGIADSELPSETDPYTWEIARIKREGELNALRSRILDIQRELSNNAWDNTQSQGKFKKLGEAITKSERALARMRLLLKAIRDIDPNND